MSKENKILLALGVLNPILYYISPYLFLIAILGEHIIVIKNSETLVDKLWKSFILASMYFGVQIAGFKLYDIIIIGFLPVIIMNIENRKNLFANKEKMNHLKLSLIYICYLAIILILNKFRYNQILEFIRYSMAILTMISFYLTVNKIEDLKNVIEVLPIYALKNLFSGIVVMILMMYFKFNDTFSALLVKVNIYNSLPEIRLTGFFSDPNKYFLYFIFILIVYEFYMYTYKYKDIKVIDKINIVFIIGAISSLSRTGIIAIIVYLFIKFINLKFFYDKQKIFLKVSLVIILVLGSICLIFPNAIIGLADKFIYMITVLIGREESLIYSSSISESSRIMSWGVALESVSKNPIFGNGLYSWPEYYYMPPHNTFICIIQDTGIIGVLLFLVLSIYGIRNLPIHVALILLLIPMMTFDLQNYRLLYLVIAILVTSLSEGKRFNISLDRR